MGKVTERFVRPWALVAVVALAGCAHGQAGMLRGTTAQTVKAPASSVARYETRASGDPVIGPADEAAAVRRGVQRAAKANAMHVEGDGRLALLAAWTSEHLGEGGTPPPYEVVEFFAHHLGLVEPTPHLLILGEPDPSAIEDAVADSVSQYMARQRYDDYGATVVERQGLTLTVIVLSSRWLDLTPVPRRVAVHQPIRIEGSLRSGYHHAKLVVARPDGGVDTSQLGDGVELHGNVDPSVKGQYRIEVIAQGPRGDTVVANFPVFVGVEVPEQVTVKPDKDDSRATDPAEMAAALLHLLNRARSRAGVPPVQQSKLLDAVAEAHSRDMVEHGFVGHTSPTTGTAPQRVARAGIKSGLILENIGRGYSANEIQEGLLESPGHRANMLNPDVTHVGIGVVADPEGSRTAYVVTEVFVRMAADIDVASAPGWLLEQINRGRKARGAKPVESDPNLAKAAQKGAERFFRDPKVNQHDVVDDASAQMRQFAIAFHRVGGVMVVVDSLDQATRLEPTLDPDVRYVGIGVAQGTRPDVPPNSIAVVILLGWPR